MGLEYDDPTMVGRYNLIHQERLERRFRTLNGLPELESRYNIAPSQQVLIVTNRREMAMVRWGLVPHWAREATFGAKTINARAETVAEKPAYREALRARRCLVPATGFYEWRSTSEGKIPYHVRLKGGAVFGMAGLYESWTDGEGRELRTCAIITTEANQLMAPLHDRMPVIIRPEDEDAWLDRAETDPARLRRFLVPYDPEAMEAYPISTLVNRPAVDDERILEPG